MVGKNLIIRLMEEFLGEYIINISKENLQVAVLRGKVKIDNVQLDGDLIGRQVLGSVGLSDKGFAVISCTAAKLRASIPWSKLEREPTKFELIGVQLICVPLLPSNAMQMHGAGTEKDPRCSLRTRVKRSTLARFERNFFSGRIPGEGPPKPNDNNNNNTNNTNQNSNANMDDQTQSQRKNVNSSRRTRRKGLGDDISSKRTPLSGTNMEDVADDVSRDDVSAITSNTFDDAATTLSVPERDLENLNDTQRNAWGQRLAQKIFRNMEISLRDIHIRCEVGQGALNSNYQNQYQQGSTNEPLKQKKRKKSKKLSDESAFTFGIMADGIILHSANSTWRTGRNIGFEQNVEKDKITVGGKENGVQDMKYKVFQLKNMSLYWDDSPPVIVTESTLLHNQQNIDPHKIWSVIRIALDEIKQHPDPGSRIRSLLEGKVMKEKRPRSQSSERGEARQDTEDLPSGRHFFVISPSSLEVRLMLSNLGVPEPSQCQAEVMPCEISMNFNPKQMRQYRALQYALMAQQRLDTMLHQRPKKSPIEDPRAWWRYAISCVTTRPNARPWRDVKQITAKRSRYIQLVEKKNMDRYIVALSKEENAELLNLEELLPIETLLSFHLIALRNVLHLREIEKLRRPRRGLSSRGLSSRSLSVKRSSSRLDASHHSVSPSRGGRRSLSRQRYSQQNDDEDDNTPLTSSNRSNSRKSQQPDGNEKTMAIISAVINDSASSFDNPASPRKSSNKKALFHTPTKSPLPRKPRKGRNSGKKSSGLSPSSFQRSKASSKVSDDEVSLAQSIDSMASLELDSIVNGIDSASRNVEFSVEDVVTLDFDKDEELEDMDDIGMQKTFRCHSLSLILTVMNKRNDRAVLKGNLKASSWIRQIPGEGTTLLFDLKNLRFLDCDNDFSKLLSFEVPKVQPKNDRFFASGVMVPLSISNNSNDDIFLESFCDEMRDGELALPPSGVVSRLLVSERPDGRSFSLSAHAATMVWNGRCIDAFMGTFFPSQNLESRSVLQNQLRNAATPVAHRAQVALTSPKSMSINVNIDAPKIWFPVSKTKSDGALFVDVGKMTVRLKKPEFVSNMRWSMDCTGIHAKFRRSAVNMFQQPTKYSKSKPSMEHDKNDIPIILPLNLHYEVERSGDGPATIKRKNGIEYKQSKVAHLAMSRICIKLVDVEVLARAIGKWYATQLLHVKQKQGQSKDSINQSKSYGPMSQNKAKDPNTEQLSEELSITVEKVELYLQRQSHDTFISPSDKRTYLVELANICLLRARNGNIRTHVGSLEYVNIAQMKECGIDSKRQFRRSEEPQHTVLKCKENSESTADSSSIMSSNGSSQRKRASVEKGAMRLKFLHNETTRVDDLDVNFGTIDICVTTISLRDCYGAVKRVLESIKIITGEMERRVHEEGRREFQNQISNNESLVSLNTLNTVDSIVDNIQETSLILKVSLEKIALLFVGDADPTKSSIESSTPVIQMLCSALIMYQSVENLDCSGNKTFHTSLKDYSVSTKSELTSPKVQPQPVLGPVAIDFRSVNDTENSGIVVRREVSISCDVLKSCFFVNDIMVILTVARQIWQQIERFNSGNLYPTDGIQKANSSPLRHHNKGPFIATTLKLQLQPFSLMLMRNGSEKGICPFFDLRGEAYGKLEGCTPALDGELRVETSAHFFSLNTSEWEYLLEWSMIVLNFEQQPNDRTLNISTTDSIKLNITSDLISGLSEFSQKLENETSFNTSKNHKIDKTTVTFLNSSGADFFICFRDGVKNLEEDFSVSDSDRSSILLEHGKSIMLNSFELDRFGNNTTASLVAAPTAVKLIGYRRPIVDLPFYASEEKFVGKFPLVPKHDASKACYNTEPVVEWCMQNQRLLSAFSNISGVDTGADLLSNNIWSPSDRSLRQDDEEHWLYPYLDDDVHEWTDMTGMLRLERERVMLPDNKWIWANDWSVNNPGTCGENADADGWEYAKDFKSFGFKSRYFKVGDTCRRRRWTRTRLMKPPKLDDPLRPLAVAWKSFKDSDGNHMVEVTSPITVQNSTDFDLTLFGYSHSWKNDQKLGDVGAGKEFAIPVHLSCMTYIRLAIEANRDDNSVATARKKYSCSDHILIIPCGHISEAIFHVSINPQLYKEPEWDLPQTLHFTIKLIHKSGCTRIAINPILRVSNLMPCPLQFRLSEANRHYVSNGGNGNQGPEEVILDEQLLEIGMESTSNAVDVALNPSIGFRVPGYRWSYQQRIVNRKCALSSWCPTALDKEIQFKPLDSASTTDEYYTTIDLERLTYGGDPLSLILEVVPGDCPQLRIYAQYWIIDRTGFGLRFCDGMGDLLGTTLETERPRRSYLIHKELQNVAFREDMEVDGHEWTIGMSGMTFFFSKQANLAISIDFGDRDNPVKRFKNVRSKWSQLVDISNVMPKAVFSVDEFQGDRRFDLSYDVSFAPSIFSRTKIITLYNRFHLINLSENPFYVSQDMSSSSTLVPPKSAVPFHWESKSLEQKVRLSVDNKNWTPGVIQIDTVGITAMRLPCKDSSPMVVQTEVRLAKTEYDSAVVVIIWYANDKTNPLYMLKNNSSHEIFCSQSQDEPVVTEHIFDPQSPCSPKTSQVYDLVSNGLNCGLIDTDLQIDSEHFTWNIPCGTSKYFGFDNPNKSHIIEWTCRDYMNENNPVGAKVEIDALSSSSEITLSSGRQVGCTVRAEHSTKVIEFFDIQYSLDGDHPFLSNLKDKLVHHKASLSLHRLSSQDSKSGQDEHDTFTLFVDIAGIYISVIENSDEKKAGREIFLVHIDHTMLQVSRTRDGYHEFEMRVQALQIDNHIERATHAVMFSCPNSQQDEPFLHVSAVRKLQNNSKNSIYRYAAFRMLAVDIALDRRTAEVIVQLLEPLQIRDIMKVKKAIGQLTKTTATFERSTDIQDVTNIMTSRRIYIEQLHLHPIRISLTFTQEWDTGDRGSEKSIMMQYIKKIPSLSNAELTFTSFVVSHAFESTDILFRIISVHYLTQLTKHFFSIIGSLAILNGPADFLANIGTGVRDFFYEPINGLVHGPDKFIEGLENGSISLARGIFVGVVRGAANVTYVVNSNLINLTDEDFIDERNAYQRSITDKLSRGEQSRTISDSLQIAGASIVRGVRSGAIGLVDEPWQNFARQGPIGFVKGVGKGLVGAIIKPVIGVGDGAVVVMNHMSEVTSNESTKVNISKRLRRALPRKLAHKKNSVLLVPYDEKAAKAQKIVTGNETKDDAYLCHVNITNHLVIASDRCLWIINRASREPWCLNWEEISHFQMIENRFMEITVFSQTGLMPHSFEVDSTDAVETFLCLLSMQSSKMGNSACRGFNEISDPLHSTDDIPGIETIQIDHIFGSVNNEDVPFNDTYRDEIEVIELCYARVKHLGGESRTYFSSLDEESWTLVSNWRFLFSGLNSRRCMIAGFINGTGENMQIKSTKLVEGGSPCYHIPTRDYDEANCILGPGAAIIFFAWGSPPSLKDEGGIFMNIETNAFYCNLLNRKSPMTAIEALPRYYCTFLERSISEWWAKYWVIVKCKL